MTIRAHKQAILDRLRADSDLAGITFEGTVTGTPTKYVTVHANTGFREKARFSGPSGKATFTYTVHSVGATPDQAQWVAERVFAQLLDYRPTITGRNTRRISHEVSRPVQKDSDASPPLFYCVDQFDLISEPA